ncbi:hypothetical protein J2Z75_001837 [Rhizobium herbae]|uniref:Uncharacterized protein n=1 Tax=Rhizobium herbae TaxID=508661 RepID=A0ABS4EK52_9HYPH|nr:hypothetical protein [Rhizobium herbae]
MTEFVALPPSASFADISPTGREIVLFPLGLVSEGRKKHTVNLLPCGGDVPEGQRGVTHLNLEMRIRGSSHVH